MKKYTTTLLALAITTSMSFAGLFDSSLSELKIKGLYTGMPMEEALVASKKAVEGTSVSEWAEYMVLKKEEDGSSSIVVRNELGLRLFTVLGNKQGEVVFFAFEWPAVNAMFKATDMSQKEFAQMFIDAYNIPELKPGEYEGDLVYTFPSGVAVEVAITKGITVWKTTSQSERKSAFN